jgi:hypothetical protein
MIIIYHNKFCGSVLEFCSYGIIIITQDNQRRLKYEFSWWPKYLVTVNCSQIYLFVSYDFILYMYIYIEFTQTIFVFWGAVWTFHTFCISSLSFIFSHVIQNINLVLVMKLLKLVTLASQFLNVVYLQFSAKQYMIFKVYYLAYLSSQHGV